MAKTKRSGSRRNREKRRSDCPISCSLDVVGDKWTLLIIRDLMLGKKRYGEFLESPEGIPTNILAERLKRLEAHKLVRKVQYSKRPPRAEYHITEKGEELGDVLDCLSDWGMKHFENTRPQPMVGETEAEEGEANPATESPGPVPAIVKEEPPVASIGEMPAQRAPAATEESVVHEEAPAHAAVTPEEPPVSPVPEQPAHEIQAPAPVASGSEDESSSDEDSQLSLF